MSRRLAKTVLGAGIDVARTAFEETRMLGAARRMKGATKLHLGSGEKRIQGWLNIDLNGGDVTWDLTRPLPFPPHTVKHIYSEHFIEHVPRAAALQILRNCRAVLSRDGAMRVSTPDLRVLVSNYMNDRLVQMPHGGWFPETPCQMVNEGVRLWGHQFLYDERELKSLFAEAGFSDVRRMKWRESDAPELAGLETRPDFGDLILEARP